MALYSLHCASVPLRYCSLTHSHGGACDNLMLAFFHNGLADFRDYDADGVPCLKEAVHQTGVLVT